MNENTVLLLNDAENLLIERLNFISSIAEHNQLDEPERAALERLITIAKSDTGQARRVADFLLAWWNATTCRAFDLTDSWGLDEQITNDMSVIFHFIVRSQGCYPDMLGYEADFLKIIAEWRPHLSEVG